MLKRFKDRWLTCFYWAWPWNDNWYISGPFYYFFGLGPWTLWTEFDGQQKFVRLWVEWNNEC